MEKTLTLLGFLINGISKKLGACINSHKKIMDDDPEIAIAQNPKIIDGGLGLLEKIQRTFTDSIPNNQNSKIERETNSFERKC